MGKTIHEKTRSPPSRIKGRIEKKNGTFRITKSWKTTVSRRLCFYFRHFALERALQWRSISCTQNAYIQRCPEMYTYFLMCIHFGERAKGTHTQQHHPYHIKKQKMQQQHWIKTNSNWHSSAACVPVAFFCEKVTRTDSRSLATEDETVDSSNAGE